MRSISGLRVEARKPLPGLCRVVTQSQQSQAVVRQPFTHRVIEGTKLSLNRFPVEMAP